MIPGFEGMYHKKQVICVHANGTRHGLPEVDSIRSATQAQRVAQDFVAHFVEENCEFVEGKFVPNRRLYTRYDFWCRRNGLTPKHRRQLGNSLSSKSTEVISVLSTVAAHAVIGTEVATPKDARDIKIQLNPKFCQNSQLMGNSRP